MFENHKFSPKDFMLFQKKTKNNPIHLPWVFFDTDSSSEQLPKAQKQLKHSYWTRELFSVSFVFKQGDRPQE